jgi:hypothetical protein
VKRLRSFLGSDAVVFGPTVAQLLITRDLLAQIEPAAPRSAKRYYNSMITHLSPLSSYGDLTKGLTYHSRLALEQDFADIGGGFTLAGPRLQRTLIGFTGVEEAASALFMLFLIAAVAVLLLTMARNPAFKKAVDVRARELDRILGELNHHMEGAVTSALDFLEAVLSITDKVAECEKSPSYQPSPECDAAKKLVKAVVESAKLVFRSLKQTFLIFLDAQAHRRPFKQLIGELTRLMASARWVGERLLEAFAEMKKTCNCPDV